MSDLESSTIESDAIKDKNAFKFAYPIEIRSWEGGNLLQFRLKRPILVAYDRPAIGKAFCG